MMIVEAIKSLAPNASWSMTDDDYDTIVWYSTDVSKPSKELIDAEVSRLEAGAEANAYRAKRANEYPPLTDYLDGIVKGDQSQINKYIADCQAVKAKYPKGA